MVGCVIVHKGRIIGEGYHQQYGTAHAEVNAINSVKPQHVAALREATLYVNLEPCSHFGKTPPCTDLIIKTGFKYVVIGTIDPNPIVRGRGLQKLVSAGCDVKVGILENECRELNKRFFTFYEKKRPYIILKWAETKDKYIGVSDKRRGKGGIQISGSASQKSVHQWRSEEQAIMVGTNTALIDNPKLTVRKVKGNNPVRILLDRQLKVPSSFHILNGSAPTIAFTAKKKSSKKNLEYAVLDFGKDILKQVMNDLHERQIQSLLVEGGPKLLTSFIQKGVWDEARVFTASKTLAQITGKKADARPDELRQNDSVGLAFGRGVEAPSIKGRVMSKKKSGSDQLVIMNNIS